MMGTMLKLAAFLAIFSVAPAAATQRGISHRSSCPMERARAVTGTARAASAVRTAVTALPTDRLSSVDGWVFGPGQGSGILNP